MLKQLANHESQRIKKLIILFTYNNDILTKLTIYLQICLASTILITSTLSQDDNNDVILTFAVIGDWGLTGNEMQKTVQPKFKYNLFPYFIFINKYVPRSPHTCELYQ